MSLRETDRVCVQRSGGTTGSGETDPWETVNEVIFPRDAGVRRTA